MKPTVLAAGIILIVMGIGGNYSMEAFLTQCQEQMAQGGMFKAYLADMCDQLKLMQFGIVVTAVVGFGVMVYGAVAKGPPKKTDQVPNN
ncbi:MAG: hypothetical protein WDZ43_00850 [Nitrosopumilaceae archaeon]